jgi:hypothetical protein
MKLVWIGLPLWMCGAGIAWGECTAEVKADLSKRFPEQQVPILCGEAPQSYTGTPFGNQPSTGTQCMTKTGSCPLSVVGPISAPCVCDGVSGYIK